MNNLKEPDIKERLLKNDTLFRDVHIIKQNLIYWMKINMAYTQLLVNLANKEKSILKNQF